MVKSAIRVFELLEVFEAERRPLRIAEMVALLDAPQSSVSMLAKTLVARGYMDFEPVSRTYCPSARVAFLCDWTTRAPEHKSELRDAMRQIARTTGETVILARRSGLFVQYVSVLQSRHALRFELVSGTRRPLYHAALGIMLLTQLDDDEVGKLLRRYNAETRQGDPIAAIADTVRAVRQAREQGWYESANLATHGAGVICTLLATPIRGQRLGIGVGAPLYRLQRERKNMLAAIREVSAQF
ncbi:MAG: helix-turn-helix domain-containing protein [Burkholderiaceae bacterium]|jgi:DNA-binding IclR family transcriptional regulator|nr:helix-turn-helix domain-containing protein [Burkholderiaceae bacterium]